jgi:hypothetical protein
MTATSWLALPLLVKVVFVFVLDAVVDDFLEHFDYE